MARIDNQDAACAFVREIVSIRSGQQVVLTSRPERENRTAAAVEELWESPSYRYAVEHTRLEAFEGQIEDDQKFLRLIAPLKRVLAGKVPGTFSLRINVGDATLARVRYDAAQREIAEWILSVASSLDVEATETLRSDRLTFEVQLFRRHADGSKVIVSRWFDGDVEALRFERISRALAEKCPKLSAATSEGRISVLVVESSDVPFGNVVEISRAVKRALAERADPPDQIHLVETEEHPWVAWVLKEGTNLYPYIWNVPESGPHYQEGGDFSLP